MKAEDTSVCVQSYMFELKEYWHCVVMYMSVVIETNKTMLAIILILYGQNMKNKALFIMCVLFIFCIFLRPKCCEIKLFFVEIKFCDFFLNGHFPGKKDVWIKIYVPTFIWLEICFGLTFKFMIQLSYNNEWVPSSFQCWLCSG